MKKLNLGFSSKFQPGNTPLSCEMANRILLLGGDEVEEKRARNHQRSCGYCGMVQTTTESGYLGLPTHIHTGLRWLIAALVFAHVVLAGPWTFGVDLFSLTGVDESHLVRDGAVGMAVGSAGALVLFRPRYAQAGFLFGVAGLLLQIAATTFDTAENRVGGGDELIHLMSLFLVVTVGFGALQMRLPRLSHRPDRTPPPDLRPVDW